MTAKARGPRVRRSARASFGLTERFGEAEAHSRFDRVRLGQLDRWRLEIEVSR